MTRERGYQYLSGDEDVLEAKFLIAVVCITAGRLIVPFLEHVGELAATRADCCAAIKFSQDAVSCRPLE